jgi:hypothetical protein
VCILPKLLNKKINNQKKKKNKKVSVRRQASKGSLLKDRPGKRKISKTTSQLICQVWR